MEWKEPASAAETRMAHEKLGEIYSSGKLALLGSMTGVRKEALLWMTRNEPFMPYSVDFCRAVADVSRVTRSPSRTEFVSTRDLADRIAILWQYGYSYSDMARGRGFSKDLLCRIAKGRYPHTERKRHDDIERMLKEFERKMRYDMRKTMEEHGWETSSI